MESFATILSMLDICQGHGYISVPRKSSQFVTYQFKIETMYNWLYLFLDLQRL